MNGKTYFWTFLRRESREAAWPVRLRLAEARLLAELRALYGR